MRIANAPNPKRRILEEEMRWRTRESEKMRKKEKVKERERIKAEEKI